MRVKICGIMREEDALLAQQLGADFVGVVMAPESGRNVSAEKARRILSCVSIPGVVVTTHSSLGELRAIVHEVAPTYLQLHSEISPEVVGRIAKETVGKIAEEVAEESAGEKDAANAIQVAAGKEPGERTRLIKTIHVSAGRELGEYSELMDAYLEHVEYFLLDGAKGGSGKTVDWGVCAKVVAQSPKPVFLAGGLNPANVGGAIGIVRPFGVDVSSGVEESLGKKSREKMGKFIEVAKDG
jgi:phosphoribosylanthranilate isomerase